MRNIYIILTFLFFSCDNIERDKKVELGEKLFNDKSLSATGQLACVSCHPAGNVDRINNDVLLGREWQTQTLWNVMNTGPWLWDGKDMTMLELVTFVLQNSMASPRVVSHDEKLAIIAYMETLISPVSPFLNTDGTMTDIQKEGKAVFENTTRANCVKCHYGEFFTDQKKWDVNGTLIDTPSLSGMWDTAPYWHNGTMSTIQSVLTNHPWIKGPKNEISPPLTSREKIALEAYLNTL